MGEACWHSFFGQRRGMYTCKRNQKLKKRNGLKKGRAKAGESKHVISEWLVEWLRGDCGPITYIAVATQFKEIAMQSNARRFENVNRLASFSDFEFQIVPGFRDGGLRVWEKWESGLHCVELRKCCTTVSAVVHNGKQIMSGFGDGTVYVWVEEKEG